MDTDTTTATGTTEKNNGGSDSLDDLIFSGMTITNESELEAVKQAIQEFRTELHKKRLAKKQKVNNLTQEQIKLEQIAENNLEEEESDAVRDESVSEEDEEFDRNHGERQDMLFSLLLDDS